MIKINHLFRKNFKIGLKKTTAVLLAALTMMGTMTLNISANLPQEQVIDVVPIVEPIQETQETQESQESQEPIEQTKESTISAISITRTFSPIPTLAGISIDVEPDMEYEEYMKLREFYFDHRYLDQPASPFAPFHMFAPFFAPGTDVSPPSEEVGWSRVVRIGTTNIRSIRYNVTIDGRTFEVYCVDPHRPGPETITGDWAIKERLNYNTTDPIRLAIAHVLRNGHPNNLNWSLPIYDAYVTGVAVVRLGERVGITISGDAALARQARELVDGTTIAPIQHVSM